MIKKVCGIEDDGLPLPPKGNHPVYLKGYKLDDYIKAMAKARRSIHRELKTWKDSELNKFYSMTRANRRFTRMWTLYHVLEHYAAHFGQIQMIKHMMRDAGALKNSK